MRRPFFRPSRGPPSAGCATLVLAIRAMLPLFVALRGKRPRSSLRPHRLRPCGRLTPPPSPPPRSIVPTAAFTSHRPTSRPSCTDPLKRRRPRLSCVASLGIPPTLPFHRPLGGGIAMGDGGVRPTTPVLPPSMASVVFIYSFMVAWPNRPPCPHRSAFPRGRPLKPAKPLPAAMAYPPRRLPSSNRTRTSLMRVSFIMTSLRWEIWIRSFSTSKLSWVGVQRSRHWPEPVGERHWPPPAPSWEVATAEVSVADAVKAYLFNSQLLSHPEGGVRLIAPEECRETPSVAAWLERAVADPDMALREVCYLDLRESMRNGGGPACLRQRVVCARGRNRRSWRTHGLARRYPSPTRLKRGSSVHYRETLHCRRFGRSGPP